MPVCANNKGKGRVKNEVNVSELCAILKCFVTAGYDISRATIEQVSAMPGQGVSSMFSFGDSFGSVRGILAAFKIPLYRVTPARWKHAMELTGAAKDASISKVMERYPGTRLRKKDDGIADAVLIAEYGRRQGIIDAKGDWDMPKEPEPEQESIEFFGNVERHTGRPV
jgi:crossover junction endodeoxyribonuclease RuvC